MNPPESTNFDLWFCQRQVDSSAWSEIMDFGSPINTTWSETAPALSADGLTLLFSSNRPGGKGGNDLWQSSRKSLSDSWGAPTNLSVNSAHAENSPRLSGDGLTLLFSSSRDHPLSNDNDLWQSTRVNQTGRWSEPQKLSDVISSLSSASDLSISDDGSLLLYRSKLENGLSRYRISKRVRRSEIESVESQFAIRPPTLSDGLVGMWTFDDGAKSVFDRSGYGHHGTIPGWTEQTIGGQGAPTPHNSHQFRIRSETSSMEVEDSPDLDLTEQLTISMWIRESKVTDVDHVTLLSKQGGTGGYSLQVLGDRSDQPAHVRFRIADGETSGSEIVSQSALQPHGWQHIAVTYDQARLKLYIDGRLDQFVSTDQTIGVNDDKLRIGADAPSENKCDVDEVYLFNRELSAEEIGRLTRSKPTPPLTVTAANGHRASHVQQALARHLNVPIELTDRHGIRFRLIPSGEFMLGADASEFEMLTALDKRKRVKVSLQRTAMQRQWVRISQPFYIGVCELTQQQYQAITEIDDFYFSATGRGSDRVKEIETANLPVANLSWNDCVACCNLLSEKAGLAACYQADDNSYKRTGDDGYRLPTEAEWEFACRAGTTTAWSYGGIEGNSIEHEWTVNNARKKRPYDVGTRKANPYGLFDMHGNVREWCQDWYERYTGGFLVDPTGASTGTKRVYRGGSWWQRKSLSSSCYRSGHYPGFRFNEEGFRPVLSLEATRQLLATLSSND